DDSRCISRRHFIDLFHLEIDPTDPVCSSAGHDLDRAVLRPLDQMPAILTEDGKLAFVSFLQSKRFKETEYLSFVGGCVMRFADYPIDIGMRFENFLSF